MFNKSNKGKDPGVSRGYPGGSRCASHEVFLMTGPDARRQADRTPTSPIRRCPLGNADPTCEATLTDGPRRWDRPTLAGGDGSAQPQRPPGALRARGKPWVTALSLTRESLTRESLFAGRWHSHGSAGAIERRRFRRRGAAW